MLANTIIYLAFLLLQQADMLLHLLLHHLLLLPQLVNQALHLGKARLGLDGLRHHQPFLPLGRLLLLVLLLVELLKVLGDDGDGKGHDEDARDRAEGPDQLAKTCGGGHVAVADGGHGDHHPVEGVGDGRVLRLLLLPLDEVAQGGEEEAGDADEENEKAELLVTVLQGEGNRLQTGGMPEL